MESTRLESDTGFWEVIFATVQDSQWDGFDILKCVGDLFSKYNQQKYSWNKSVQSLKNIQSKLGLENE